MARTVHVGLGEYKGEYPKAGKWKPPNGKQREILNSEELGLVKEKIGKVRWCVLAFFSLKSVSASKKEQRKKA